MVKSGETATFTYNADGLRIKKVCTSTGTTNYTLCGKSIVHLENGSNNLHFFYDVQNRPAIVVFNGVAYGFVYNLQGDIIAIVNSAGTKVVEYTYDTWGKPLSKTGSLASTLGALNPFRYRRYLYDEETGLYYLYARFYSGSTCRFLSEDNFIGHPYTPLLSHNSYAYCQNKVTCFSDCYGKWLGSILLGVVLGVACEYIYDVVENFQKCDGEIGLDLFVPDSPPEAYIGAAVGGALSAMPAASYAATAFWGAAGSVADDLISQEINFDQPPQKIVEDIVWSAATGGYMNACGRFVEESISIQTLKKAQKELNRAARKDLAEKLYPQFDNINDQPFMLMHEVFPVSIHPIRNTIYSTFITIPVEKMLE